jgi:hypothetical protein
MSPAPVGGDVAAEPASRSTRVECGCDGGEPCLYLLPRVGYRLGFGEQARIGDQALAQGRPTRTEPANCSSSHCRASSCCG